MTFDQPSKVKPKNADLVNSPAMVENGRRKRKMRKAMGSWNTGVVRVLLVWSEISTSHAESRCRALSRSTAESLGYTANLDRLKL